MTVDDLRVCTISKYPPYMSGHSFESMYQNRALFELTGNRHYEVTYHADTYNKESNYNDEPELMRECETNINVCRIIPNSSNQKVFDGALSKAFLGTIINLIESEDINVLSTYYLDPHAHLANEARDYAEKILNKRVLVAHKAVGSDILDSIANHLNDGQAKFLLLQLLKGDLMYAVSNYTKEKILEYAKVVLPQHLASTLEEKIKILYAPFDTGFYKERNSDDQEAFRLKFGVKPGRRVISYFGRVFPEKGIENLLDAYALSKQKFPDVCLVIGGYGVSWKELKKRSKEKGLPDVIFTGPVNNKEKRALMQISELGVIPTKPISNFVETLCICALEYQASGTPLLTTRVGGVPEAAGEHSFYAKHSDPDDLAEKIREALGLDEEKRKQIINRGYEHISQFDYKRITKQFVDDVLNAWSKNDPRLLLRIENPAFRIIKDG